MKKTYTACSSKLRCLLSIPALIAAGIFSSSLFAQTTTIFEYRLGEDDLVSGQPAVAGNFASNTRNTSLATADTMIRWSGNASPQYTANTPGGASTLALDFAGANSGLYVQQNFFGTTNNNLAIEAWIKPDVNSGTRPILYIGEQGKNGFGLYQSSGFIFGQLIDTGNTLRAVGTGGASAIAPIGEWSHVALVRNGGTWNVYLNGTIVGGSRAEAPTLAADLMTLGTWNDGDGLAAANFTNWFDGSIDNVRGFTFEAGTFNTNMFTLGVIPEPSTYALVIGLLALAFVGYRKRRA